MPRYLMGRCAASVRITVRIVASVLCFWRCGESAAWRAPASDLPSTAGPVYAIHRLLRRRAGVPQRGTRPLSHFVGRTRELVLLHERLADVYGWCTEGFDTLDLQEARAPLDKLI